MFNNIKEGISQIDRKQLLLLGIILLLLSSTIVGIYLLKQRQEIRSRASSGTLSLVLNPSSKSNLPVGEYLDIDVGANIGQLQSAPRITGVDINLKVTSNSNSLTIISFTPDPNSSLLNTQVANDINQQTMLHYLAVNPQRTIPTSSYVRLGTLRVKAEKDGAATLTFGDTQIVASGRQTPVTIASKSEGSYTIGIPVASPTPSSSPTPTGTIAPTPTITLTPTATRTPTPTPIVCINGDANKDGCVGVEDYTAWEREVTGRLNTKTADFYTRCSNGRKGDGVIDGMDYTVWEQEIAANRNSCSQ